MSDCEGLAGTAWWMENIWDVVVRYHFEIEFNSDSGQTITIPKPPNTFEGTYECDGESITINISGVSGGSADGTSTIYTGTYNSSEMSGTMVGQPANIKGRWNASKELPPDAEVGEFSIPNK